MTVDAEKEMGTPPPGVWAEYKTVSSTDVLQQGDLIRFKPYDSDTFAIVVTADCDLDKRKHSRMVTLVPLLSVEQIICRCLAFDYFETQATALRSKCRARLGIDAAVNDPAFVGAVKALVRSNECGSDDNLLFAKIVAEEQLELAIDDIKLVLAELSQPWPKRVDTFGEQIQKRGDFLILAPPPLLQANNQVAWLRALRQEPVAGIALATSREADALGIRIAQLTSPYRYRLTQMLGQVFSDIGLPDRDLGPFHSHVQELRA